MRGYEQLFKKDKADFNDYLILFDLDIYYVEKLQILVLQCTTDGTGSADWREIEPSGLLLMQLPWLFAPKFPVFDPRTQCEPLLTGESPDLNSKVYISLHGKIVNIKEDKVVFHWGHWNMMMKIERILFLKWTQKSTRFLDLSKIQEILLFKTWIGDGKRALLRKAHHFLPPHTPTPLWQAASKGLLLEGPQQVRATSDFSSHAHLQTSTSSQSSWAPQGHQGEICCGLRITLYNLF